MSFLIVTCGGDDLLLQSHDYRTIRRQHALDHRRLSLPWVLNCQPHDVPILVAARLLKPLVNPPPNSVKFFAASELLELVEDRTWLGKVTNAVNQHWQKKNAAKKTHLVDCSENGLVTGN